MTPSKTSPVAAAPRLLVALALIIAPACADEPGPEGSPEQVEKRGTPPEGKPQLAQGEAPTLSDAEMHPLHPLEHHFGLELPRSTSMAPVAELFKRTGGQPSNVAQLGDPGPVVDKGAPAAGGDAKGESAPGGDNKAAGEGTGTGAGEPTERDGRDEALGVVPNQPGPTEQRGPGAKEGSGDKGAPAAKAPPEAFAFSKPTVLVGRHKLYVGDAAVADVRCHAGPEPCEDGAREGPTSKFELDFAAAQLDGSGAEATVKPLAKKLGEASGEVRVLADRRVSYGAVAQVLATVRAAGGEPVLVVSSYGSEPVALWSPGKAGSFAPPGEAPPTGGTSDGGLPATLASVQLSVGRAGVALALTDAEGQVTRPQLVGNVLETVAAWSERIRRGFPDVREAGVDVAANAPFEELARVLDGLRDTCAARPKGTPCHEPKRYFENVTIEVKAAAPSNDTGKASDAPAAEGDPAVAPGLKLRLREPGAGGGTLRLGGDKPGGKLRLAPAEAKP